MSMRDEYAKARRNFLERVRYAAKKGISFLKDMIPPIPKRPTKGSVERLNKMGAAYIARHSVIEPGATPAKESTRAKQVKKSDKPGPKTKEFQSKYRKEAQRIKRYIREQAKKGVVIDYTPPETPDNISPAKLRELKELTPKKLKSRYGYKVNTETGELAPTRTPLKGSLVQRAKQRDAQSLAATPEAVERRRKNMERINLDAEKRARRNARKRAEAVTETKPAHPETAVFATEKAGAQKTLAQRYLEDVQKAQSLRDAIAAADATEKATGITMPELYRNTIQEQLRETLTDMDMIFPNQLSGNDALVAAVQELPDYESQVQSLEQLLGPSYKKGIAESDKDYISRAILELRTRGFEEPGAYRPKMSPLKHLKDLADTAVKNGGAVLESLSDAERDAIDATFHPDGRILAESILERIQGAKDVFYKEDGTTPKSQFIPEIAKSPELMKRKIIEMGQVEREQFAQWVDENIVAQRRERARLEKSKREVQREKKLHMFDDVEAVTARLNDILNMIDDVGAREQAEQLMRIWQQTLVKYSDDEIRKYVHDNEYDLFSSLDEVIDIQEIYRFLVMEAGMEGRTAWEEALKLSRAAKLLNMNQPLPVSDGLKKALAPRTKSRWDEILDEGNYKGLFSTYSIDTNGIRNIAKHAGVVLLPETEESFAEWKDGYLNYTMEQKRAFGEEHGRDMNLVIQRMDDEVRKGGLSDKTQREFNMLTDFLMDLQN